MWSPLCSPPPSGIIGDPSPPRFPDKELFNQRTRKSAWLMSSRYNGITLFHPIGLFACKPPKHIIPKSPENQQFTTSTTNQSSTFNTRIISKSFQIHMCVINVIRFSIVLIFKKNLAISFLHGGLPSTTKKKVLISIARNGVVRYAAGFDGWSCSLFIPWVVLEYWAGEEKKCSWWEAACSIQKYVLFIFTQNYHIYSYLFVSVHIYSHRPKISSVLLCSTVTCILKVPPFSHRCPPSLAAWPRTQLLCFTSCRGWFFKFCHVVQFEFPIGCG